MSETNLQRLILRTLDTAGFWAVRMQVKGRSGPRAIATGQPGMPDIWTPWGWLEVKVIGGKLNESQLAWHAKARAHCVRVCVVTSPKEALEIVSKWREMDEVPF